MNQEATKFIEKKKKTPAKYKFAKWLVIIFCLISLTLPMLLKGFHFAKNRILLALNQYKWQQIVDTQPENIALRYGTCHIMEMPITSEMGEVCLLGATYVEVEEGFQYALNCIETFACDVEFNLETGTPSRIHFQQANVIFYLNIRQRILIYPTDDQ